MGTRQRRPIVLLAPDGAFYAYILTGLANGFMAHGYPCIWLNDRISQHHLAAWARKHQPYAVLEINRALAPDVSWPAGIPHLAWIQDRRFEGEDFERGGYGKSDHLYFILLPEIFELPVPADRSWSLLLPAARPDPTVLQPVPTMRDFSVVGYIPPPVPDDLPVALRPDGRPVTLAEMLPHLPPDVLRQSQFSFNAIRAALDAACQTLGCALIAHPVVLKVFEDFLPRSIERRRVVEGMLSVSKSLHIFGPPDWLQWPQFAPYYKGHFADPLFLGAVYRTSRINMHNGELLMHFRVLDCLACGAFLLINTTKFDDRPGGIHNYFEPDRHYGAYPIDDIAPVAKRYLADEPARLRIAAEARREVMAAHTWTHRVAQILGDLGLPRGAV